MNRFVSIVFALFFMTISALAQESDLQFDQHKFGDRFCVLAVDDGENNYYVTDLTKLPSRFERIYFLNLVYKEKIVVNIDPDIDNEQMWFKAFDITAEEEVICLINDLKDEALEANAQFSDEERSTWLEQYDKYKKTLLK